MYELYDARLDSLFVTRRHELFFFFYNVLTEFECFSREYL